MRRQTGIELPSPLFIGKIIYFSLPLPKEHRSSASILFAMPHPPYLPTSQQRQLSCCACHWCHNRAGNTGPMNPFLIRKVKKIKHERKGNWKHLNSQSWQDRTCALNTRDFHNKKSYTNKKNLSITKLLGVTKYHVEIGKVLYSQ